MGEAVVETELVQDAEDTIEAVVEAVVETAKAAAEGAAIGKGYLLEAAKLVEAAIGTEESVAEAAVDTPEAAEAAEGAVDTEAAEDADETAESLVETVADAKGLLTETLSTALIVLGTTASSLLTFILLHFLVLPTWGLVGRWPLLAEMKKMGIAGGLAGALGSGLLG